jgi:hypothetical protein
LVELDKCVEKCDCDENAAEIGVLDVILRGARSTFGKTIKYFEGFT